MCASIIVFVCAALAWPALCICVWFEMAPFFLNVNVRRMRPSCGRCENSLRLMSLARHRCHSVLHRSSLAPSIRYMRRTHILLKYAFTLAWFSATGLQAPFVTELIIKKTLIFSWGLSKLLLLYLCCSSVICSISVFMVKKILLKHKCLPKQIQRQKV